MHLNEIKKIINDRLIEKTKLL